MRSATRPRQDACPRQRHQVWRVSLSGLALLLSLLAVSDAPATDLVASVPQTLYRGTPAGPSAMLGGNWSRNYRARELPSPATAVLTWQQRLIGGLACNLLVDATGAIFAVGTGRVSQLGADGTLAYSQPADLANAVAAALLLDGSRVVLARAGRVLAWAARGAPMFQVELDAPARWLRGGLLPLPDGGVLVAMGSSLFELDSTGKLLGHTRFEHEAVETFVNEQRIFVLSERGEVFEWDGHGAPSPRASFGGPVSVAALSEDGTLIGVVSERNLVELSLARTLPRRIAAFDAGLLPLLGLSSRDQLQVIRSDGHPLSVNRNDRGASAPPRASRTTPGPAALLTDSAGALAWISTDRPLVLRGPEAEREFAEIRCGQPVSLVSAGLGKLIVGCRSGQIWFVGLSPGSAETVVDGPSRRPPPQIGTQ